MIWCNNLAMPSNNQPPVCLGRPMQHPALIAYDLSKRLSQPDWVLILPDIRAEVRVWDDGHWEWLHLSGTLEERGTAEGATTAAARAQEAILRRARTVSAMAPQPEPDIDRPPHNPQVRKAR